MKEDYRDELRKRILDDMVVNYNNALEKNFELANKFISLTKSGSVEVKVKDSLKGEYKILLYLIGKVYAFEAGLSDNNSADNKELMNELGIPGGSLYPWLKKLREKNRIKRVKVGRHIHNIIMPNLIEKTLKDVEELINKT
jgi:hypothetical protein